MHMNSRHIFAIALVLVGAAVIFTFIDRTEAQSAPAALTGVVSSQQEAQMEGVLVSAKRAGSTVTVTVATGAQGRYTSTRTRLEPGMYAIRIRAIGYDLDGSSSVQVSGQQPAQLDLK